MSANILDEIDIFESLELSFFFPDIKQKSNVYLGTLNNLNTLT